VGTIEAAVERGAILRTWPMRGTIHFMAAGDARWMVELLDEWAPDARTPADPMAELAARYFTSHGPATVRDFGWWSGLSLAEVREAIERAGPALAAAELDGKAYWHGAGQDPGAVPDGVHLLPAFDEYTVAYSDRSVLVGGRPVPHGDLLNPVMVLGGLAVGLWRRSLGGGTVTIQLAPFGTISTRDRERFREEAERYGAFLGLPATVTQAAADQVRRLSWQ
jgi:DNA glycosylase AlkZ-like